MSEPTIALTEDAARQIKAIIAAQTEARLLRVSVIGGGCSGFSYKFDLESQTAEDDLILERDGARVAIDPDSVPFLDGSKIDYVDELLGAAFKIDNPNAVAACGCGVSFTI
ncbi:HesB/IscA family protein [Hyphobacterium marinum]|uniref:Iron-sulfur cluster assembly accessory protein n=1 Tax=Hyphobacterium marinum TaxID=3116574 RepID=A0ABU7M254_9PROT|nr:iron-sulfur cluster assembly accessory protein [Hyphobacterium sp. Y6023]MEE2567617.1 iron-sulfur cluster assembly accessory protein [Hyphobacterium sp. Y6023]